MDETIIRWDEVFGNPGLTALHPAMLTKEGYKVLKVTKIKGESKKKGVPVTIIYDESYVIYYITTKIIQPLRIAKYNELQQIIAKCWNAYKTKNK